MIKRIARGSKFKAMACLTAVAFTVLAVSSCVSFKVNQIAVESHDELPSIAMKIYMKAPGEGQEDSVCGGVGSTLSFQQEDGTFVPVASSRQGSWLMRNSPAGTYRIEIDRTAEIDGKTETFDGSLTETFSLKPGERAEIVIVLKKVPVGVIVLISVLVVGLIVLMIAARQDKLPKPNALLLPPLPHLPGIPPPRALLIPLAVFAPHGRPIPGPPPLFIDGGFYAHGPFSAAPYDEPPPVIVPEQPPEHPASSAPTPAEQFFVYPRKGQSEGQQAKDRYECHLWAVAQTGWDPGRTTATLPEALANTKSSDYKRALAACLDAREYTVK